MKTPELLELRHSTGLNQTQFWKKVGLTQSTGSRYENGRTLPKPVATLVHLIYVASMKEIIEQIDEWKTP